MKAAFGFLFLPDEDFFLPALRVLFFAFEDDFRDADFPFLAFFFAAILSPGE